MGIPGFNTWFYGNNKQAYQSLQHTQTDHLYIDMNSVLHNVLRKAETYDKYHALLHKRLDMILRITNPRKSVMFAIDGPAPLAKLITQRERRKKSFTSEGRKKERQQNGNHSGNSSNRKSKKHRAAAVVSSTALTPGTPFMHDVCVSCSYFICARLATRKWAHLEFELSGPTVAGEGEVKILGRLARPRHAAAVNPTDTHLIVGDDADLILMALVSKTPRLHILNSALSGNELSPKTAVLSVDKLHAAWLTAGVAGIRLLPHQQQQQQEEEEDILMRLLGAKADLALLAVMASGNDYLPAVRETPNLATLWNSYVKLRKLPQFANSSIITMTPSSSSSSSSSNGQQHSRELSVSAELDTLMLSEVLAVALEGNKYLQQLQQKSPAAAAAAGGAAGSSSSSSSDRGKGCGLSRVAAEALLWLKGVLWTMSMYFAGDCPNYRWRYSGQAPSASGLRALAAAATAALAAADHQSSSAANGSSEHHRLSLSSFDVTASSSSSDGSLAAWQAVVAAAAAERSKSSSSSSSGCESLLPHVCSLALLPAGAQEHVPAAVQHLMEASSPVYDMYASCDGCEQTAAEQYRTQMEYNAILEKVRAVDAEIAALQQQQQLPEQQQQHLDQLLAQQVELLSTKATALGRVNAALYARRRHEATIHPNGVDTFDLERLEAAVAAIPASQFTGSQKVLTQLSHSMLFRIGRQQQQQQRYGGFQAGSQQQHGGSRPFSSSSSLGSRIVPPPPPVERFGPAFSSYGASGTFVARSILLETAHECAVADDLDVAVYGNYMVVGTEAAAAAAQQQQGAKTRRPRHGRSKSPSGRGAAAAAAGGAAAAPGAKHPRRKSPSPKPPKQQQQQQQGGTGSGPAPSSLPMPSGVLLGRLGGGSSSTYNGRGQQQQQVDWRSARDHGAAQTSSGPAAMQYEYNTSQQQQQQPAAAAVAPQSYAGFRYNPLQQQQQYQYQQQQQQQYPNQQQQYYTLTAQHPQQQYSYPQQQVQQQQQYHYVYQHPYHHHQQQQQVYQPLRSVSPGAAAAASSSVPRPLGITHPASAQAFGSRPQHPGMHFPRP